MDKSDSIEKNEQFVHSASVKNILRLKIEIFPLQGKNVQLEIVSCFCFAPEIRFVDIVGQLTNSNTVASRKKRTNFFRLVKFSERILKVI